MWIPRNKKTGTEYQPVTDAEKAVMEKDHYYRTRYTFRRAPAGTAHTPPPVPGHISVTVEPPKTVAQTTTATEPVEAKKAKSDPAKEPETEQ